MYRATSEGLEPEKLVAGLTFSYDRFRAGAARLALTGELDLVTAARAAVRIRRAQDESRVLICDLGGVWLLDFVGLRVLLDAAAYAQGGGRRLLVANAPSIVPRMLRLLRLEHALEVPALPLRTPPAQACASFRPHVSSRAGPNSMAAGTHGEPVPHRGAEPFRCEISRTADGARVRLFGDLDIAAVPELRGEIDALRAAGVRRVILDLSRLRFMDSTGLRCILEYDAEARQDGFALALVRGPRAVQRVFQLTHTEAGLPFID